jgi:Ca2+-binding EF-hand superfamily protein
MSDYEDTNADISEIPSFRDNPSDDIIFEFTEAQREEFQILYNKIDRLQTGAVSIDEIGALMRACGLNPTNSKVQNIISWCDENSIEKNESTFN